MIYDRTYKQTEITLYKLIPEEELVWATSSWEIKGLREMIVHIFFRAKLFKFDGPLTFYVVIWVTINNLGLILPVGRLLDTNKQTVNQGRK